MTTSDEWREKLGMSPALTPTQLAHANLRIQNPKEDPIDPACYDLAKSFLDDYYLAAYTPFTQTKELAVLIQDTIESFIAEIRKEGETS